jgi:hypothetical protein
LIKEDMEMRLRSNSRELLQFKYGMEFTCGNFSSDNELFVSSHHKYISDGLQFPGYDAVLMAE